jgi:hypothetical protein
MTLKDSINTFVWHKVDDLNSGIIWPTVSKSVYDSVYGLIDDAVYWLIDDAVYWSFLTTNNHSVNNLVKDTIRYYDT